MSSSKTKPSVFLVREPVGFWSLDLATNLVALDDTMRAFFSANGQKAPESLKRESLWEKIHPEDLTSLRRRVQEAVETRGPFAHTYRMQITPQFTLAVRVLGRCLSDDMGKATHVAGILMEADDDEQTSAQVKIIEHLMEASRLAEEGGSSVLAKLIDAVLFEAGRDLARSLASGNSHAS